MRPGMQHELWRASSIFFFSLFFGWSLDLPLQILVISLAIYLLWIFKTTSKIFSWIDRGMRNIPPNVDGVWGEVADTLNRQRRRHKKSSEKLRTLIRRATKVTESLDQGVVVLKKNRTLDWWNTSAKTLLNLRSGDRGSSIMNLIREPHFIEYINKSEFSGSIRLMSNVQKDILLDLEASFIDGQDIVLVITDVSRLSKLELLKAEFVGNVSHELRTPLTVLRGYLETLEDLPNKNALETKAYEQMAEQVVRMQTLADDLILLSQMEEESQEIQNEEVDIVSMLNSIIDEAKVLSAGRHHFSFESQPLILQGHHGDIRAALGNIIFNAGNHNPDVAEIKVNIQLHENGIMIVIADDGVGMQVDEIPKITERFYRGDNSRNSKSGGSGLGLAIAKHALTRANASLNIISRPGQGATFECLFPLHTN